MEKVTLTIDKQKVEVEKGTTVLEAAKEVGIDVPSLCYHPDLTLHGACRVCVVENVENEKKAEEKKQKIAELKRQIQMLENTSTYGAYPNKKTI